MDTGVELNNTSNALQTTTEELPRDFSQRYDTSTICPEDADPYLFDLQYRSFGLFGTTLVCLGLIGNLLSVIVLSNKSMRSATSFYLLALAIYDSILLLALLLCFSLPVLNDTYKYDIFPYMQPSAYAVVLIALTCSIYTTVGFTVERYIAVCHPLNGARYCTIARARKAILIILILSIVINTPRMFEYHTYTYYDPYSQSMRVNFERSKFGQNVLFRRIYIIGLHIPVMMVIPCIVLIVLNWKLIQAVRESQRQHTNAHSARENNITVMLIIVVAAFVICELPSVVYNVLDVSIDINRRPEWFIFYVISQILVFTNSAINFYLYCLFGNKFRHVFRDVFCLSCLKQRPFRTPTLHLVSRNNSENRSSYIPVQSTHVYV